jgi:hypothetical protein
MRVLTVKNEAFNIFYGLFKDAVSSADYTAWNYRMINEVKIIWNDAADGWPKVLP